MLEVADVADVEPGSTTIYGCRCAAEPPIASGVREGWIEAQGHSGGTSLPA